jgi:hypothetical protein
MHKKFLAAATAIALGGAVAGTWLQVADAQPAPAPQAGAQTEAAPPPPPPAMHPWMHEMMEHAPWMHGPGGPGGPGMRGPGGPGRNFGLIFTPADRQLTTADVQKIAEAFLLWHGNHSWKVANVAQNADGKISFDFTTDNGGVIARFTMDAHNGHVERVS